MNNEEKKCCCDVKSAEDNKENTKSCCHSEKTEESEPCCCHSEPVKEQKGSCCHSEKADETTGSCCHSGGTGAKTGFQSCCGTGSNSIAKDGKRNYKPWIILGISFISLILSFTLSELLHDTFMRYLDIGWIAVVLCGTPIFISAVKSVAKGKITSGVLISIAILACIALEILILTGVLAGGDGHSHGYIFAAGEVAFLMQLGGLIEEITVGKARSGIERLVSLSPQTAKYKIGNEIVERPVAGVKIGDVVVILPNDIISVDGRIISGATAVDESVMTGESVPVDKAVGDAVFGGTQNKNGAIEVEVTKTSDEMTVNKLKKLVEEAEGKKAPISRTADKWASFIVPGAILMSIVVFLLTYFAFKRGDLSEAVLRGVTMLVVFCPCALALATPTAVAAGLGAGTKRGVLIKSGAALEELAKVKTVAFDKTGTLSHGRISVIDIIPIGTDSGRVGAIAGACERMSEHPIAKAVVSYCSKLTNLPIAKNTKSLVGTGVESEIDGKKCVVCKWEYLDELRIDKSLGESAAAAALNEGKTVIAVVEQNVLIGLLTLSDEVREGAAECISELHGIGISTVMLTGDNKFAAAAMAKAVGVKTVEASLMPEDKLKIISNLKTDGKVCMVGDGVNDAPALAAADCSIAMGALGSDVAIETADIALMNSDIKNVAKVIKFSKKVLTTIKINIIMSMTINVVALILNLCGLLNPVIGALIHNCSSVLVVLNSALLLNRWEKERKTKI